MALLDVLRQAQREREAQRLDGQAAEPSRSAQEELGAGARHVAEALPFLGMSFEEFRARGALLEVQVPWLDTTLWFVPIDDDARLLMAEGVRRGRIWTSGELMQLLTMADRTQKLVSTITYTKLAMDADVVAVRHRG